MSGTYNSLAEALAARDFAEVAAHIPYARLIGIECIPIGNAYIFKLPRNDDNLGNPTLPAIHGGVIGGFMETAAVLHTMMSSGSPLVPKVVDFSLDYLRPGRHTDTFAECTVVRLGRKIANVEISAWQTSRQELIASARAHFLLDWR